MTISFSEKTEIRRLTTRGGPLFDDEPRTLAELFLRSARKHDLQNVLTYKRDGEWRRISSSELLNRAKNIAAGLHSLGLRKTDRAAILAPNSPEWTLADAGCQFAGVVDVPIYTTLSPSAVKYILNDSGAKVLFLEDRESYERIEDVFPFTPELRQIVFLDEVASVPGAISLGDLPSSSGRHGAHGDARRRGRRLRGRRAPRRRARRAKACRRDEEHPRCDDGDAGGR